MTGAVVAARLGWSLRNIQTQLQRVDTTPSDLIREERLALARLRLQDPAWFRQSVTQVAYASGFGDLSTFSNAYRRHFGERPSDTRSAARDDA
nr:helix-turn-helix transcriptional regulator [Nocardioides panzhihuensis]